MRFLVDAQLPPALARMLTAKGQVAGHVSDFELQAASDRAIWDYALQEGLAIITKDEDFVQLKNMSASGPIVIWIRRSNTRRRELLIWFEAILPAVLRALEQGETLIEVV